jgi:hypothetical protein
MAAAAGIAVVARATAVLATSITTATATRTA